MCFQEASRVCYNKAALWLRMAECCVAVHVRRIEEQAERNQTNLVKYEHGNGPRRRLILVGGSGDSNGGGGDDHNGRRKKDKEKAKAKAKLMNRVKANPKTLTLDFALKALRNCLYLLKSARKHSSTEEYVATSPQKAQ